MPMRMECSFHTVLVVDWSQNVIIIGVGGGATPIAVQFSFAMSTCPANGFVRNVNMTMTE